MVTRPIPRSLLLAAAGVAFLGNLTSTWAQSQSASGSLTFEVASVKLSDPNAPIATGEILPGGRYRANVALRIVLQRAYDVRDFQLFGGPAWLNERYTIQAKAPEGNFSEPQIWQMVQRLLEERCHLKLHRETKEVPLYALIVGKNGSK